MSGMRNHVVDDSIDKQAYDAEFVADDSSESSCPIWCTCP